MRSRINKTNKKLTVAFIAAFMISCSLVYITASADIVSADVASADTANADTAITDIERLGLMTADSYRFTANLMIPETEQQFDIAVAAVDGNAVSENNYLFSIYLSGSDIKKLAELDASYAGKVSPKRLYTSGLIYEVNTKRPKLDKVSEIYLSPSMLERSRAELEDNKIYRVAVDTLSLDIIEKYAGYSHKICSIPNEKLNSATPVVYNDGTQIHAKDSYEKYILSFFKAADLITYDSLSKRKIETGSLKPADFFKNTSRYFIIFTVIIIALILIVIIVVRTIILNRHKKKVFIE